MSNITEHIRSKILLAIITVFCALGIVSILLPHGLSWDGSVYTGMGKYLFSNGMFGVWEVLRPVGFPIVLGLLWKIGIDPYVAGKVLALAGAAMAVWLTADIADRLRAGAGIFAAAFLSFTPLFFSYAAVPMTDIISVAFVLGAVRFALKPPLGRNIIFAGLFTGLAFLFRFPQGLALGVVGMVVIIRAWLEADTFRLKPVIRSAAWCLLGFLAVALPFFIVNFYVYGDAFLPLKAGSAIIARAPAMYLHEPSFYLTALLKAGTFMPFVLVPLALFIFLKRYRTNAAWIAVLVYFVVYFSYFTHLAHKELRYMLAFLPAATILAGAGIAILLDRIGNKRLVFVALAFFAAGGIYASAQSLFSVTREDTVYASVSASLEAYHARTGEPAHVLAAAPFLSAESDARIEATLYDDWREVLPKYASLRGNISHVLIDTCTLESPCPYDGQCLAGKAEALTMLGNVASVAVDGTAGRCRVTLYALTR